jgi:hypothetical protein
MTAAVRWVLAALAIVAAGLAWPAPVSAQDPPPLRLVAQSLVLDENDDLTMLLEVVGEEPAAVELVLEVNGPLEPARLGLAAALLGAIDAPTVGLVRQPLDEVPRDGAGRLDVAVPTVVARADKRPENIRLPTAGAYAVRVDLRAGRDAVVSRFTTFVVRADDELRASPPLPVATVLPSDSPPTLRSDASIAVEPADRDRLRTVTDAVRRDQRAALSVAVRPALVDGLTRTGLTTDAELVEDLASGLGGRSLVATTFERVDPASLVGAGLGPELTAQLRAGEDALSDLLGAAVADRATWVADGVLDGGAVDRLRDLGVRQLVLPHDTVIDPSTTTGTVALASATGDPVTAVIADQRLSEGMVPGSDPVLSAYRLLAELLTIQLDTAPDERGRRGVVVLPPRQWSPDPTFLATLLSGLATTPLLDPVTLDDWFAAVDPLVDDTGAPVPAALAPVTPPDLGGLAGAIGVRRYVGGALATMVVAEEPPTGLAGTDELLDTTVAADLTDADREPYFDEVDRRFDVMRSAVEPVPEGHVTLAGRSTEIPLTLRTTVDFPVRVRVHLASAKLEFPDEDQIVVVDGVQQVRVPVETRASGTFPLTVQVLTPEGDVPVAPPSVLTVQVSALSGLGIVLIVGLLLVLATWWVQHVRKGRRAKATAAATERHPAGGPADQ